MSNVSKFRKGILVGAAALAAVLIGINVQSSLAYERYSDGCQDCHGDFDGPVSTKGTIFPSDSKHEMHRGNQNMNAACTLCHVSVGDSPLIGESGGTNDNRGVGCVGCHGRDYGGAIGDSGVGLRRHHHVNNVVECAGCHTDDPAPLPENILPTYYGTADTDADDSCNSGPGFLENWSIGDTVGLDNDGDNQYDGNDADCGGCPWDCAAIRDGAVGVTDFLALLAQWGQAATSCDFGAGGIGVDVSEFLAMLAQWGPCP